MQPVNTTGPVGRIARGIDLTLKMVSSTSLLVMLGISIADVIARYAMNAPIYGAAEMIAHCLVLTVFSAMPIVSAERRHITVDLLEASMPQPVVLGTNRVLDLVSAGALFVLAYAINQLGVDFHDLGDVSVELSIPKHFVAFGISAMSCLAGAALTLRALFYPDRPVSPTQSSEPSE